MKITERDVEILRFINEFGLCDIVHIMKKFGIKRTRAYQIMKRLVEANLIIHQRVYYNENGIFYVTKKGAKHTDFPPISDPPRATYWHQLAIIDTYLNLMAHFPEARWISERRLKSNQGTSRQRKRIRHIADGVLCHDGKSIAIEVELSLKSYLRLKDIIFDYAFHREFEETWYFCSPKITPFIQKLVDRCDNIKVHTLN